MNTKKAVLSFICALMFVGSFAGFAEKIKAAESENTILSLASVEKLSYGQQLYGFSTLSPEGRQRFTGRYLGVLRNTVGPGHNWIVVELSGSFFKETGVIAGQSGSPMFVKLNGKSYKIGTVSYADSFAKNPIAYLTPIEEVLDSEHAVGSTSQTMPARFSRAQLLKGIQEFLERDGMKNILPVDNVSIGQQATGDVVAVKTKVEAGSVLGVQLAWGDFDYTGSGTVSHVDGDKIYLFGHPFLQLGPVEYRLVPSKVLTVQKSEWASYIIAAPIEGAKTLGVISQDRETGIYGQLGKEPQNAIPISINLTTSNGVKKNFKFYTISDSYFGPALAAIGVYYTVGSWSRAFGNATLFISGKIEVSNGTNNYTIDINEAYFNSEFYSFEDRDKRFGATERIYFMVREKLMAILGNNYSLAKINDFSLDVRIYDELRTLKIDRVAMEVPIIHPGDTINLNITLSQLRQEPKVISVPLTLPKDLMDGAGRIMVGDASAISELEKANMRISNLRMLLANLGNKLQTDAVYIYMVLPPSNMEQHATVAAETTQLNTSGLTMSKISKRIFANVEQYKIVMKDFIVNGSQSVDFKISQGNGTVSDSDKKEISDELFICH